MSACISEKKDIRFCQWNAAEVSQQIVTIVTHMLCLLYQVDRATEQTLVPHSQASDIPDQSIRERLHQKEEQMVKNREAANSNTCTM